ncbi:MAG: hypothetical protein HYZ14_07350 [Bacteroidetes bacterium]|nr:hypothetical protein [Bacteroidota bacterium]
MSTVYHISDVALPVNQNFELLKEQALAYIQEKSGNQWTNLNASDPGITILDQVCFALTELGYCNDFSVKDILTRRNGKLETENQFYLPSEILTTAPVTLNDYRKYVVDGVSGVVNAIVEADSAKAGVYQVWLLLDYTLTRNLIVDPSVANNKAILAEALVAANLICEAAFYYLNKSRNVAEFFEKPVFLTPNLWLMSGQIEIEKATDVYTVLNQLQQKINDAVFPAVKPIGYHELEAQGITADTLYNGPRLENGWISDEALGEIKYTVKMAEVIQLIETVTGVLNCSVAGFIQDGTTSKDLKGKKGQVIVLDVMKSVLSGNLSIVCKGETIAVVNTTDPFTVTDQITHLNEDLVYGSRADFAAEIPQGKYRDISSYYSIQNTMPEIFGTGTYAVESAASDYQVAQSRQLRGYLTLFDQLLANQFAQLANVDKLFSFKNPLIAATSDNRRFYALKSHYEKDHPEYPVPFEVFSPTYFYRSLYDVPFIRPILKDNTVFNFSYELVTETELDSTSWESYKLDPYNAYVRGLMQLMEDQQLNLQRRNEMLDHLLARHGESPLVIDALIDGSVYAGESQKDRVIFKSLYLQNLGLLSYYRQKAWNFLGAYKIKGLNENDPGEDKRLHKSISDKLILQSDTEHDFIFNTDHVNKMEKLTEQDFINFSAIELKLCLLFGLRPAYHNYLADEFGHDDGDAKNPETNPASELLRNVACWMIEERRGVIFVETNLLMQALDAQGNAYAQKPLFQYDVVILLPDFIQPFTTAAFRNRLNYFLQTSLPAYTSAATALVSVDNLATIIPAFVNYHNTLIFKHGYVFNTDLLTQAAVDLTEQLNPLNFTTDV